MHNELKPETKAGGWVRPTLQVRDLKSDVMFSYDTETKTDDHSCISSSQESHV